MQSEENRHYSSAMLVVFNATLSTLLVDYRLVTFTFPGIGNDFVFRLLSSNVIVGSRLFRPPVRCWAISEGLAPSGCNKFPLPGGTRKGTCRTERIARHIASWVYLSSPTCV